MTVPPLGSDQPLFGAVKVMILNETRTDNFVPGSILITINAIQKTDGIMLQCGSY
jgi:hypothetical protein